MTQKLNLLPKKQNKTKQNKTKQNKTKQNKTKQNKTKQPTKEPKETKKQKVLLVEDNESVRKVMSILLKNLGYVVKHHFSPRATTTTTKNNSNNIKPNHQPFVTFLTLCCSYVDIITGENGEEGVKLFQDEKPDIILLVC